MKQLIFAVLLCLSAALCARDFENAWWGMTRSEVKSIESGAPVQESQQMLIYESCVAGFPALAAYFFADGRLYSGKYIFNIQHKQNKEYITDYHIILERLMADHGLPLQRGKRWQNDTWRDNESKWGDAVASGHLEYLSCWETDTSNIDLILTGADQIITLGMRYINPDVVHNNKSANEYDLEPFSRSGFRGRSWGDPVKVIQSREPAALLGEYSDQYVDSLDYEAVRIAGLDMLIGYAFIDGQLSAGYYTADKAYAEYQNAISDFHCLNDLLRQRYGEPQREDIIWTNHQLRHDFRTWGCAVALGHLTYITDYDSKDAGISVILSSVNGTVTLMIRTMPETGHLCNLFTCGAEHQVQRLGVHGLLH